MSIALLFVADLFLARPRTAPEAVRAAGASHDATRACRVLVAVWLVLALLALCAQQVVDGRLTGQVDDVLAHALVATFVTATVAGAAWFLLRCRALSAGIGPRVGWWDDVVIVVVAVAWNASLLASTVPGLDQE